MLTIKNGKHELELKFGIAELSAVDRALGLKVEQIDLGEGLEMLIPKLKTGNIVAVAKIISALTVNQKGRPKTDEELEAVLLSIIEEHKSIKNFSEKLLDELGKQPLTQELIQE
ncbi:tail assembly chaperone [Macrococcus armenti]|uniref:tail assembly chaperone n=1 Tax=Macrococcus armenti TaxID=2875764 RepID=UPI001CCA623D|nr:tail assembly chaperone [Macrococcus armenti]UBH16405.1 tail assembly chaperone [Macrococcus armenti]UBH18761.1 tail assembly chaperone [Macrococcus armenti]UBH21033.1 tail assembly chaperone [Macrococcus armenti]